MNALAVFALALSGLVATSLQAADAPPQRVALRVEVGSDGKVLSSRPDDNASPAVLQAAAGEIASKLSFEPARRQGQAVASQTTLYLDLAFVPRGDGKFGIRLLAASSGPSVRKLAPVRLPDSVPMSERGGSAVISVQLSADGQVLAESAKAESMSLRRPSVSTEARYLTAIASALNRSRFQTDIVDGQAVAERVFLPFQLGGGDIRRDESGAPMANTLANESTDAQTPMPVWRAESAEAGIELAKVRFPALQN